MTTPQQPTKQGSLNLPEKILFPWQFHLSLSPAEPSGYVVSLSVHTCMQGAKSSHLVICLSVVSFLEHIFESPWWFCFILHTHTYPSLGVSMCFLAVFTYFFYVFLWAKIAWKLTIVCREHISETPFKHTKPTGCTCTFWGLWLVVTYFCMFISKPIFTSDVPGYWDDC